MRRRSVWAGALALALGLCATGVAPGQEPARGEGGWYTRLFFWGAPAVKGAEAKDEAKAAAPAVAPGVLRARAQADYLRRLEVCDKLHEIAFQAGDDELKRRADQLRQRTSDAYAQQLERLAGGSSPDEAAFQGHLGTTGNRSPLPPAGAANRTKTAEGRAAAGEGR